MAFHNVRLPDDVERGALGGPRFKTFIIPLSSGQEKRKIGWSVQRGQWDVGYGIQYKSTNALVLDSLNAVIAFFYARQGRAHTFKFKDWADFEITGPQPIGIGDGANTIFQIYKRYVSGPTAYDRTITLPIASTFNVYVNSVLKTITTDYTIDEATGIITFVVAPPNLQDVDVEGEFDIPVRFDTDALDISMETYEAGVVPSIPIVEVRV